MHHRNDGIPDTAFEALTGAPAPSGDVVAEAMNINSAGSTCDFCSTLLASASKPAVWAFPASEAMHRIDVGGTGLTMDFPIAAGLWYACERCRKCVKASAWAKLARSTGFPEGHAGFSGWQAFRVARLPGNGYAWPLVAHRLPDVHRRVRDAWERGCGTFADAVRIRLERARLLLEIDGHLYLRCGEPGDDRWLAEQSGEDLAAPFSARLNTTVRFTLLPPSP